MLNAQSDRLPVSLSSSADTSSCVIFLVISFSIIWQVHTPAGFWLNDLQPHFNICCEIHMTRISEGTSDSYVLRADTQNNLDVKARFHMLTCNQIKHIIKSTQIERITHCMWIYWQSKVRISYLVCFLQANLRQTECCLMSEVCLRLFICILSIPWGMASAVIIKTDCERLIGTTCSSLFGNP